MTQVTRINDEMINVCDHPVTQHNLAILRDKNTCSDMFRSATKRLVTLLLYEATKNLPVKEVIIETPLETMNATKISEENNIIVAPILRAGLVFSEAATSMIPTATVYHIGMQRNEETLEPVTYYNKFPKTIKSSSTTVAYIMDPMLATGGSAVATIKLFTQAGILQENLRFVCLLAAPEGIMHVQEHFPKVRIYTTAIDRELNENGFILPGLGDAGDRTFGTV